MDIKSIVSIVSKKQWAALGVLAVCFAVLMAFQLEVWSFILASVVFIGFASWTTTAFFLTQQAYSGSRLTAFALPVGIAIAQTLFCLGLVWLIVWQVRHLFGS